VSAVDGASSSAFLGVGWAFPVTIEGGTVKQAAYELSVQQAIWIVLATSPGERRMRPDFGSGLNELVFAPSNTRTVGAIQAAVSSALLRWEPRIDLLGVDVEPSPDDPAELDIRIDYRVRATNNRFNLVYPFYLQQPVSG
jgi:uncharacterized protein